MIALFMIFKKKELDNDRLRKTEKRNESNFKK